VVRALDAGIVVYGASSMGALRAVECAPFGAIGVGRIFQMFRTGETEADDEVVITYDPDTLRATSEPMVNIRIAMAHAAATKAVEKDTAELVVEMADHLYFPDRSYRNIGRLIAGRVSATELQRYQDFVASGCCPDQKHDDALLLLATMREAAGRRTAGGPA
jgi:TfuA protein